MNDVVAPPGAHSSFYEVRRAMIDILKRSQQIEHDFFAECRETVRAASTELTDHFSNLIQRRMPEWSEQQCREFAQHSGLSLTAITEWRSWVVKLATARAQEARAEAELKAAAAAKSDAGGLFGARKGRQGEYSAASARHAAAETASRSAQEHVRGCKKSATEAAAALLECVARSGALAESEGYSDFKVLRGIISKAATRATELTANHEREQSRLNATLSDSIQVLGSRYGVPHG